MINYAISLFLFNPIFKKNHCYVSLELLHHNYALAWWHLSQTRYLACSCNPYPSEVLIWISESCCPDRSLLRLETFCPPSTRYSCVFFLRGQLSYGSRWRTWRGAMKEIWGHPTPWTITQSHFDSHHSVSIVDLFSIRYLATDTSWLSIPVFITGCIGMLLKVG